MDKFKENSGFGLVEILVAGVVIGIIAAKIMISLTA